jgi:hypothetical protein
MKILKRIETEELFQSAIFYSFSSKQVLIQSIRRPKIIDRLYRYDITIT